MIVRRLHILSFFAASDPKAIGRVDYAMLSQQAQMEIVVGGLDKTFLEKLQDKNGAFRDICEWPNVRCDEEKNVKDVRFWEVFTGVVNLDFLPERIYGFELFRSPGGMMGTIAGTIDIALLPRTMGSLSVSCNIMSGTLDIPQLPPNMEGLLVNNNLFFGKCDISHLPATMEFFCAQKNKFRGSVCLDALPDRMVQLSLSDNFFSGTLNLKNLPGGLTYFHMGRNEFCGAFELLLKERAWLWETDFRNNKFEGTAIVTNEEESKLMLRLDDNNIVDVVDQNGKEHPLKQNILHGGYSGWP